VLAQVVTMGSVCTRKGQNVLGWYGRWPNPWPQTFGHHEFFHAVILLAAHCRYVGIYFVLFH
jgi:predicted membrane channel-forming protein YqfA (hemolysin III family)